MSIKNRKLQVFVSSTFTDLIAERQAAVGAILSTGNIPAGMELFAAGDQSQMEVIKEWIRESDVYLLILGSRYGSIEPISGKSYTHLEYEYAIEIGKPHFAVVISDQGETLKVEKQGKGVLEREHSEKYNQFKKQVTDSKLVHFWNDLSGIELAIHKSLANFGKREELIGWVRGDEAVNGGALAEELARLGKENAELRNELLRLQEHTVRDFDGLSFDELFQFFESKEFNVLEVLKNTPNGSRFNISRGILTNSSGLTLATANDILITFSPVIDGALPIRSESCNGVFMFFLQHGIVKFNPHTNITLVLIEFTQVGRRYFNRLRFLEKYKKLISESQKHDEEGDKISYLLGP